MSDRFLDCLKAFAETIIHPIIGYPTLVRVECSRKDLHVRVTISGHAIPDNGKLLGKGQQTLWSIRYLLQLFGNKHKERIEVTLMEGVVPMPPTAPEPWTKESRSQLGQLVAKLMEATEHYHGEVLTTDDADKTTVTLKSRNATPLVASAIGKIVKTAGGIRGRKIEFRAEQTA